LPGFANSHPVDQERHLQRRSARGRVRSIRRNRKRDEMCPASLDSIHAVEGLRARRRSVRRRIESGRYDRALERIAPDDRRGHRRRRRG